jgi:hypothetical protein
MASSEAPRRARSIQSASSTRNACRLEEEAAGKELE